VAEVMKRLRVFRVDSPDGDTHIVLEEPQTADYCECLANLAEIKKISKKKAAKKVFLSRQ
jgi:hypothetical protein